MKLYGVNPMTIENELPLWRVVHFRDPKNESKKTIFFYRNELLLQIFLLKTKQKRIFSFAPKQYQPFRAKRGCSFAPLPPTFASCYYRKQISPHSFDNFSCPRKRVKTKNEITA